MSKELIKAPASLAVWESNISAIKKRQPRLAALLEAHVRRNGHEFAHYETETPTGKWIEGLTAEPFFQSSKPPEFAWGKKSKATPIFFQYGVGTPPYVFAAIKSLPKEALSFLIVEPSVPLLAYTLHVSNVFAALPKSAALTILSLGEVDESKNLSAEERKAELRDIGALLLEEALINGVNTYGLYSAVLAEASSHQGEQDIYREEFSDVSRRMREWIVVRLNQIGNSAQDTMLGLRQMALISPWIAYGYSLQALWDRFKGRPFVLVSAGPSLDKNMMLLKEVRDKCVIIATDAVWDKMVKSGIRPHIVTVLERGYATFNSFFKEHVQENLDDAKDILLISQSVCLPTIFGLWPGPKAIIGKSLLDLDKWYVQDILGGQVLDSGSSVAHMNYTLARLMGASSIAIIGQDLAFSESGLSHSGGIFTENALKVQSQSATRLRQYRVPGALGGEVVTTEVWLMFLRQLEEMIRESDVPTWDCTEGGAYIAGTKVEALAKYIKDHIEGRSSLASTPAELVSDAGIVSDKKKAHEKISRSYVQAINLLENANKTLQKLEETIEKIDRTGLDVKRRQAISDETTGLYSKLYGNLPVFVFMTQSYVYLSSIDFMRARLLDSPESVARWKKSNLEIVASHRVVLNFMRHWVGYGQLAADYYADRTLPVSPIDPAAGMAKFEEIQDKYESGEDQIGLRMEIDALVTLFYPFGWSGREQIEALWKIGLFLLQEGRPRDAYEYLANVRAILENSGQEYPVDYMVAFLKDLIRSYIATDLCFNPNYETAEKLLATAIGYNDGADEELRELLLFIGGRLAAVYGFLQGDEGGLKERQIKEWFEGRALAAELLMRGDTADAFLKVWELLKEYGTLIPRWGISHFQWLVHNMEKFLDSDNDIYKTAVETILADMAKHTDLMMKLPIKYGAHFIQSLLKHGLSAEVIKPRIKGAEDAVEKEDDRVTMPLTLHT